MGTQMETGTTARCLFCGQDIVDGRKVSGYMGEGPDWMTLDGDFGCDDSPESHPELGCGSHAANETEARRAESSDVAAEVSALYAEEKGE